MAQHGYLREYDEEPGRYDEHGEREDREWRGRNEDDWRDRDRERGRDRNFMLGDDDRRGYGGRDRDEGFFSRVGDEARSWFRDDEDEGGRRSRSAWENNRDWPHGQGRSRDRGMSGYGREHGYGGFQGDFGRSGREQGGFGGSGDYSQGRRSFSSHPDDHYRSWRERQMQALDRDYEDYCREREQRFHQEFDSWRRNRQQGQSGQRPQGQQGQQVVPGETTMDLNESMMAENRTEGTADPLAEATLGTNNSENTAGRGRR